ncbi:MAG: PhzF family phenazine biosynthesis protein [Gemmataceae bacterium]
MTIPIIQVNAFTNRPFAGNPAAVCLLTESRNVEWMQAIAREMNLSETAYLVPSGDVFNLRWFTPGAEVELCGHATLASAHVLWERGLLDAGELATFSTASGLLRCRQHDGWIEMDFPGLIEEATDIPDTLVDALGVTPVYSGRSKHDYILQLQSEDLVRSLRPDFRQLSKLPIRGIIVTSESTTSEYHFVSRFFAPAVGVDEDPVTGSAHCCLAPFWAKKLQQDSLTGYQASARGGVVQVRVDGERVVVRGQAVTVWEGELLV